MNMSDRLNPQEKEEEQKLVSEMTKAMKDEGFTEEEVRQGLELAWHIRTKVKPKDDSLSDCCWLRKERRTRILSSRESNMIFNESWVVYCMRLIEHGAGMQ